jgi:hypothetical protein
VTPAREGEDPLYDDLHRWWMDVSQDEADGAVGKAIEYGANSMTELGHEIAKLADRKITDAEAIELACYFYIKGKLGRWSDSIIAGVAVSDDTVKDIGVYIKMVQRVRTNGGWPGTALATSTNHEIPNFD